ncbi:unnamed protein product [Periconia digitata]|uniref:NmrA-like domain-containing protein n=1 Tax=Periconia digitata TaxID=1303443 RepID=A0A9W4XLL2_9PLEO|nr:unnamed protein product [Periconia digitata]
MSKQYASTQPPTYTNQIRNIAIVGATGNSGKHITSALLANPSFKITALTRATSGPPPPGVHIATIDYSNPSTLVEALKNQDVLIITLAVAAPPGTATALAEAAAKAGVPWILPNEFGTDTNDPIVGNDTFVNQSKIDDRNAIEKLGVSSWIGICTGFWYEHSLSGPEWYGIDVLDKKCVFFDDGTQRINTTTWPQVGRAVANLLALPILPHDEADTRTTLDSFRNRMAYVSSFAVNQREMLDSVQRVTQTTDAEWTITRENSRERYEKAKQEMFAGDRRAFGRVLYTRYFFSGENAGLVEVTRGLDNERLGLVEKEDLDEATRKAIALAEGGYGGRYMKS